MSDQDPLKDFRAEQVLTRLHGFQRDAVEYAFDRLFLSQDGSRRFLIADEVGLGKTLIARGVMAKALEHLLDRVPRIDVVYICSNLAIAAQNIDRLNPVPGLQFSDAERITLLPVNLQALDQKRVNFVAFTPGTSLNIGDNLGTARERILLYVLLKRHWGLQGVSPLNVLQGNVRNADSFREWATWFEKNEKISEELAAKFFKALDLRSELRIGFDALCARFPRANSQVSDEDWRALRSIVGRLRSLLAETCIDALQPDLVILDEFQRFKSLLDPNTDEGELAHQLFRWSEGNARAHVLLLSATPYKAYTLQHEVAEEDHYADFLRTVAFLDDNKDRTGCFGKLLRAYREEMYRLRESDGTALRDLKAKIEEHLRKIMSRTERLAAGAAANAMVRTVAAQPVRVTAADLKVYVALRGVADALEAGDTIEYWKSAAYPLNFMEGYELRRALSERADAKKYDPALSDALETARSCGLPFAMITAYAELTAVPNGRVREMLEELAQAGAFGPLWLPPSLPYYSLTGSFAAAAALTKRLVFSAWHVVPRSLSALLTYECERRAFTGDEEESRNTPEARKARRGLLRFSESEGRLTGLPVLSLIYPSSVLASLCDPRMFHQEQGGATDPPATEVLTWAKAKVSAALPAGIEFARPGEAADERWYWAAPLLLDAQGDSGLAEWWRSKDLNKRWGDTDDSDGEDDLDSDAGWRKHVDAARSFALAGQRPDGKAPHDLAETLALIGLAGPATCALRSLGALFAGEVGDGHSLRDAAARIGWGFRTLYNRQESMALIRHGRREQPFWRLALEYGHEGCLAAVLDEYLHVLRDARGQSTSKAGEACPKLATAILEALQVRTASLDVDEPYADRAAQCITLRKHSMRTLFAMRFGSDKTEDAERVRRDSAVSAAFNSPFWPFVLATTSVGQEGLDFHWYCHAIVHWNLPSNPVDFEQREGRIHRFKGHAVRKNVARAHGLAALASDAKDLWNEIFRRASADAPAGDRGLVPYWLYPLENGACIERRVPLYPLSRDEARFHALQRSLGAYRMVFGQPRQDELLAYLLDQIDPAKLERWSKVLMMDIAPPRYLPGVASDPSVPEAR